MKTSFLLCIVLLSACSTFGGGAIDADTRASVQQAKELRQTGNSTAALELLRAAQEKFPNEPTTLQQLGYTLIETGEFPEAINVFDQLIKLEPQNAMAYNGKAVAFDHAGNHLAAQDIYKTALSFAPGSVAITNNLAMSLILNNQPKQAVRLLEPLLNKDSSNPTIRKNIDRARALQNDNKKVKKQTGKIDSSTIGFIENAP